ncbi:flagellar hook-length control protein [Brevibacillus parabrevis]|uniref:flagellar hook-length control protein FliK n=1 Tax=Brevibacillus parabrevis TaxID=54914 RepID=UPI0007AC2B6B|nr:flagellar hook-length control protein FliK [Brevibacillus parabrevis]KZE53118.1 flagellar hook-length control protein [Brevibacillus parabrevis]
MNVANLTPPVGSAGSVTTATGTAGNGEAGLGQLFSLQMLQSFEAMLDSKGAVAAPEGLSEDDQKLLDELMALIAQLLAASQQGNQELNGQVEEKAAAVEQLLGKASGLSQELQAQSGMDLKQLLSKLSQSETSSEELNKLAALLESLKNQKGNESKQKNGVLQLRSEAVPVLNASQQEGFKTISPLRMNQGLAAYKLEAGVATQTVQPALSGSLLNQEGNQEDGGLTMANQTPVVAQQTTQTQNASFQQPQVQPHHVNANQLPQQLTQLFVSKLQLGGQNGVHEAKLILNPQSLGQVDVTITSHNGVITAQFHAETQAGKDLLDNQLPQLRMALTQQGLQVDRLEVNQQQDTAFNFQQQREQAGQQRENQQQQKEEEQEFALDALVDSSETSESLWNRLRESARGVNDLV